jgi:hypothetical protein
MGIKEMLQEAAVIILNGDSYRIDCCEDDHFVATLEDGCMETREFSYSDVDLDRDLLYKFTLMNPNSVS